MTDARLGRLPATAWQAAFLRHAPVALLSGLYLYAVSILAARQPLWFDEILTYYISNLGGPRTIVSALLAKAENHPPLDYLARHFSMSLFGGSELAFRLPSIIAMLVAALCLYVIVLRRTSMLQALVAFSLPFTTFALRYTHEGRPYAFLFASMCLAFLAWQLVTEKPSLPRLALLTVCLSLGPYSHYYGVLNYVAIGVGEAWRWWEQRKIAWPVVACFAISVAIDGLLAPFVLHSEGFRRPFLDQGRRRRGGVHLHQAAERCAAGDRDGVDRLRRRHLFHAARAGPAGGYGDHPALRGRRRADDLPRAGHDLRAGGAGYPRLLRQIPYQHRHRHRARHGLSQLASAGVAARLRPGRWRWSSVYGWPACWATRSDT